MKYFDPIVAMTWVDEFGKLPRNYLAVDTETSGVDPRQDYILQLGFCKVADSQAKLYGSLTIDWTQVLNRSQLQDLERRMDGARTAMQKRGKQYDWTIDSLTKHGKHPREIAKRFLAQVGDDWAFAAHYGFLLDYPIIGKFLQQYGEKPFAPELEKMIDTGLLVKAGFIGVSPEQHEDMMSYVKRVDTVRAAPRHSMEHCVDYFDLVKQGAVKKNLHDAGYDAWCVHLLVEKMRSYVPEHMR